MAINFIVEKTQIFLGEIAKTDTTVWLGKTVTYLQANALPIALAVLTLLGITFCYLRYKMDQQPPKLKNTYQFVLTSTIFKDSDPIEKSILKNYETLPVCESEYDVNHKLPQWEEIPYPIILLKGKVKNEGYILACKVTTDADVNAQQKVVLFKQNPYSASNEWYQFVELYEKKDEVPFFKIGIGTNENKIVELLEGKSVFVHKCYPDQINKYYNDNTLHWHLAKSSTKNKTQPNIVSKPELNLLPQNKPITPTKFKLKFDGTFPHVIVQALRDKRVENLPIHPAPIVDNDSFPTWDELAEPIMVVPKQFSKQDETFVLAFKLEPEKLEPEKKVAFVQKTGTFLWSAASFINLTQLSNLIINGQAKGDDDINWILDHKK